MVQVVGAGYIQAWVAMGINQLTLSSLSSKSPTAWTSSWPPVLITTTRSSHSYQYRGLFFTVMDTFPLMDLSRSL